MAIHRPAGTAILGLAGLGAGALGVLTATKIRDDRYVDGLWRLLDQAERGDEPFTEERVAGLPDPARRYFLHAIQPGTRLASRLHWRYAGHMKPGPKLPWMALRAEQILVKERGFVWRAWARTGPLVVTASDHYLDGAGRMRLALYGLVPVVTASGPDLAKSARARLLIEGCALPSAFLPGPHVRIAGIDASRFKVLVRLQGEVTPLTLTVDQDGRLRELVLERWGNLTTDGSYRSIPYGCTVEGERTVGGYTIPSNIAGGWWYGTERYLEVMRLRVTWAELA